MVFNSLYTGGVFHCYMLDNLICHFRGVRLILLFLLSFWWKTLLANNVDPDQMPHYVASDLGRHCLPVTFLPMILILLKVLNNWGPDFSFHTSNLYAENVKVFARAFQAKSVFQIRKGKKDI